MVAAQTLSTKQTRVAVDGFDAALFGFVADHHDRSAVDQTGGQSVNLKPYKQVSQPASDLRSQAVWRAGIDGSSPFCSWFWTAAILRVLTQ